MPHIDGVNDGVGYGVKGENATPASLGDLHEAGVLGTSQGGVGVFGTSGDIAAMGIFGSADIGVQGVSADGTGVDGRSASGHGVTGNSSTSIGVSGFSGSGDGVHGETPSLSHSGVSGLNTLGTGVTGSSNSGAGVVGSSTSGVGVLASSTSGNAVEGVSASGYGVRAQSNSSYGVYALSQTNDAVHGETSSEHAGVSGTNAAGGPGVYGASSKGNAGQFEGNLLVSGDISSKNINVSRDLGVSGNLLVSGDVSSKNINVSHDLGVSGNINVKGDVLLTAAVTTGGDCAERFDLKHMEAAEPGTVMIIDDDGALRQCDKAYDRKVAGVVSGAGAFKPGIVLDQRADNEGRTTIALVGKVYCKVDADTESIAVGDLLTTSETAGHAMKVSDPFKGFGSVIGKALRPLASGKALLPILVSLQ